MRSRSIKRSSEDAGPLGFARIFAGEYAAMKDGHDAQLLAFLTRAYYVYRLFRQFTAAYQQLTQDAFWECQRHKPQDLTTSKWLLLFLMRPETPHDRALVSRYTKIFDGLARDRVKASRFRQRIRKLGGVEAAHEHFVVVERERQVYASSLPSLFTKKPPPVRPKRPLGKHKRKLGPGTGPRFSIFAK
jgi:hypothetical protein